MEASITWKVQLGPKTKQQIKHFNRHYLATNQIQFSARKHPNLTRVTFTVHHKSSLFGRRLIRPLRVRVTHAVTGRDVDTDGVTALSGSPRSTVGAVSPAGGFMSDEQLEPSWASLVALSVSTKDRSRVAPLATLVLLRKCQRLQRWVSPVSRDWTMYERT